MSSKWRMRSLVGAFLVCSCVAIIGIWSYTRAGAGDQPDTPRTVASATPAAGASGEVAAEGDPGSSRDTRSMRVEFSAEDVIGNPDCQLGVGGASGDVAVVVLPAGEGQPVGARFATVDGSGTLFGGELPFLPNHYRVGRRADGSVLAAFADLRRNSKAFRNPESAEPLHVYMDGALIYETDKTWQFGLAPDGSSFFAIEPLAGEASRLVIRNLDLGTEVHHDLGGEFNPLTPYYSPYGAFYSGNVGEVVFWPPQELNGSPRGDYWFYPVDGSEPRVVRVETTDMRRRSGAAANAVDQRMVRVERLPEGAGNDRFHFESSEVAYHIEDAAPAFARLGRESEIVTDGLFKVTKVRYEGYGTEEGPQRTEVWNQGAPMHVHTWRLSEGGSWLALRGTRRVWVLDTSTGDYALAFPTMEDVGRAIPRGQGSKKVLGDMNYAQWAWASATLPRLRDVLGPDATVEDVGSIGGMRFIGDRLVISVSVGPRGDRRRMYDVFDMNSVEKDGAPVSRIAGDVPCGRGGLHGLGTENGRLVYSGMRG